MQIRPICTIIGAFNAEKLAHLKVAFQAGADRAVNEPPKVGAFVIVLVQKRTDTWIVPNAFVKFLPGGSPLASVGDVSISKIDELVQSLRKARKSESQ